MTLQLISMSLDAAKKVGTAVKIQHDALPARMIVGASPLVVVRLHLDPLSSEILGRSTPLPPFVTPHTRYTFGPKLLDKSSRRRREVILRNDDLGCLHPMRGGNSLSRERLDILHGVFGSIVKELTNNLDCLVIGDVDRGFRAMGFPMQILSTLTVSGQWRRCCGDTHVRDQGRDNGRGKGDAQCDCIQCHDATVGRWGVATLGVVGFGCISGTGTEDGRSAVEPKGEEGLMRSTVSHVM
jgi:hypothetical protein